MSARSNDLNVLLRDTQWAPLSLDVELALARVQLFGADADTASAVYSPEFIRHLLGHIQVAPDPKAALGSTYVSELYLAFACVHGKPAAIRVLEANYLAPLEQLFLRKNALAWTKDVGQLLRTKLLVGLGGAAPALAAYAGRGALAPWLKVTATRVLLNDIRATPRRASAADDDLGLLMDAAPNPELDYLRRSCGAAFKVALTEATAELTAEERNLLRFAIVDKLDADAIANVYGVHRTTAGRRLALARDVLATRTREALKRQLRVSDKEFESIVRLVHSQLDVTFERLLRDTPP